MTARMLSPGRILRAGLVLLGIAAALILALLVTPEPVGASTQNNRCPPGTVMVCLPCTEVVEAASRVNGCECGYVCVPVGEVGPPPTSCDGGKVARRFNMVSNMWERNLCDDLWLVTGDPFDMVFGRHSGGYGWDYGEALQYLLDEGYSQSQLSTVAGQNAALVSEGLWDTSCNCVPDTADLTFLYDPGPPPDPGYTPWAPMG
jgi:hypothetical protein